MWCQYAFTCVHNETVIIFYCGGANIMDTVTLTIRLTPELKSQVEAIAKSEDRSLNNLINIILKKYVKDMRESLDEKGSPGSKL